MLCKYTGNALDFKYMYEFPLFGKNHLTIVRKSDIILLLKSKGVDAKISCSVCKRERCVPQCPLNSGDKRGYGDLCAECVQCGEIIYKDNMSIRKTAGVLCPDCALLYSADGERLISRRFFKD